MSTFQHYIGEVSSVFKHNVCLPIQHYVEDGKIMENEIKNRIKELRTKRGLTLQALADLTDTSNQQIYNLESGKRGLDTKWMSRLAKALGVRPEELIASPQQETVPLVGFVGAGARVYPVDDHEKGGGLEEVEAPPGVSARGLVAVRVRGDSMAPRYDDGEVLFFTRKHDGVPDACLGRYCIVGLQDGDRMVKKVRQGSKPGHYHLVSVNSNTEPMLDVPLVWAALVLYSKQG
jgi:phage repressor protein C with HTH and peptisase S24 domain